MKILIKIIEHSFIRLRENFFLIIPSFLLFVLLSLWSNLSERINYSFQSSFTFSLWLIFFGFVYLGFTSFFLSGLIGLSKDSIENKFRLLKMLQYGKRFWFRMFLINLIVLAVMAFIFGISLFIGSISIQVLSPTNSIILDFLIKIAGLLGAVIFLSLANFYLVIRDFSVIDSVKTSHRVVKKNYGEVLIILLSLFILNWILLEFIGGSAEWQNTLIDLINSIIIVPLTSLLLTEFALERYSK